MKRSHLRRLLNSPPAAALTICLSFAVAVQAQQEAPKLVPSRVTLSKTLQTAVSDKLLTEQERNALRLFHGLVGELPETMKQSPAYALAVWDIDHSLFQSDTTDPLLRAEAAMRRGDLHLIPKLIGEPATPAARLLLGEALAGMGRFDEAIKTLSPLRDLARQGKLEDAPSMVAALEATVTLAVLEGRPAADYHFVLDKLSATQQNLDRLHWPALIAQARLLMDKDNPEEALGALHEALRLNPIASEAWYLLGEIGLLGYDFDSVQRAILKLRNIQPHHPLASLLEVKMFLTQKDPMAAQAVLLEALTRYPNHRELLACKAAAAALQYDAELTITSLQQYAAVAGGDAQACYVTGKYLSAARQYEAAEQMLGQAMGMQPNWTRPQIELGLLLNQAGKEEKALAILKHVSGIDPFNKRAANTLKLLEELAGYQQLETEHFIIKWRDPIDGALAADMPAVLEKIYADVTAAFSHRPSRKTLIEIMPDKRWFAVRITGMPGIWTIGAATGPVIAITPPREGGHHAGPFDWPRVIRHEYTHTVTLDQTANRIPHWFTEAAAVGQEPSPRDYETSKLLAKALRDDELFDLESINWAFVRPRKPTDRALAYAQAHWMYEYITQAFGHRTILKAMELCRVGVPQNQIVPLATKQPAEKFLAGFKAWAEKQVESWGLAPNPSKGEILRLMKEAASAGPTKVQELLSAYPDHPDLLQMAAEAAVEAGGDDETTYEILQRYAAARPIDPWADRELAQLAIRLGRSDAAVAHLEQLDRLDQQSGAHATTLMQLYQQLEQPGPALRAAERALARQPYDAQLRESAATLALQTGDTETALRHLRAVTLIEPDRSIHFVRLAAMYARLGKADEAKKAAEAARKLDPAAPVDAFLK